MHPFDLPEPLSDKSTPILLDLAVLHISLVSHPDPNHELIIRSSHLPLFLSPNFPPLFHLQRVHHLLPVYYSGDMPLAIGSGIFTFLCKIIKLPPSYVDVLSSLPSPFVGRKLPVLLLPRLRSPADSTCAMILSGERLPLMVSFRRTGTTGLPKSVDPFASPATSFISILGPMAPPVSPPRGLSASSVSPRDPTVLPVSPRRNPMAPPVFPRQDSMAPPVFLRRDPMAPPVSPVRDLAAPLVSFLRNLMAPPVFLPRDPIAPPVPPRRDPAVLLYFLFSFL